MHIKTVAKFNSYIANANAVAIKFMTSHVGTDYR